MVTEKMPGSAIPSFEPPRVEDLEYVESKGPWTTKSEAELLVRFALPYNDAQKFNQYEPSELSLMPEGFDIRGASILFCSRNTGWSRRRT